MTCIECGYMGFIFDCQTEEIRGIPFLAHQLVLQSLSVTSFILLTTTNKNSSISEEKNYKLPT